LVDAIFDSVARVVANTFHCDPAIVREDSEASDIDGWDSLSHVYLIMAVEHDLKVTLPLSDVMECANVGELAALVRKVRAL